MRKERRVYLNFHKPAESKIYEAVQEIEKLGADERLTNAQLLLHKASQMVSDYLDERITLGELISFSMIQNNVFEIDYIPSWCFYDLKSDLMWPSNVPIKLMVRLMADLNIPTQDAVDAMKQTCYKLKEGKGIRFLFENHKTFYKYINLFIELTTPSNPKT